MPPAGLIDTGAILAIVEIDDRWHNPCLEALMALQMPLLTTEAVLTELFHLVRHTRLEAAWNFVRSGALTVHPMDNADLSGLQSLMAQYKDRPMDFADATLVHLAARESLSVILTVDHDDFETYRIGGRKRFIVLPARERK
ncbi:MAG TPA: PIN domain-containing protein [Terriglobales bacterium]|nr:PIN domain-containing protein [Terriglobales bacterium]